MFGSVTKWSIVTIGTLCTSDLNLIFVNDFPNWIRSSQGNLFADDTICYAQGTTTEEVQTFLQFDVCSASKWYKHNKLSLNIEKSGCMLLGTRQMIHNNSHMDIILDGKLLQM